MNPIEAAILFFVTEEKAKLIKFQMWYLLPYQKNDRHLKGDYCGRCLEKFRSVDHGCSCDAEIQSLYDDRTRRIEVYLRSRSWSRFDDLAVEFYFEQIKRHNAEAVEKGIAAEINRYFPNEKPEVFY